MPPLEAMNEEYIALEHELNRKGEEREYHSTIYTQEEGLMKHKHKGVRIWEATAEFCLHRFIKHFCRETVVV